MPKENILSATPMEIIGAMGYRKRSGFLAG